MKPTLWLFEVFQDWVQCAPKNVRLMEWFAAFCAEKQSRRPASNERFQHRSNRQMKIDLPLAVLRFQEIVKLRRPFLLFDFDCGAIRGDVADAESI